MERKTFKKPLGTPEIILREWYYTRTKWRYSLPLRPFGYLKLAENSLLHTALPLVGRLKVLAGFLLRPLRVVFGANRQIVFADGALALPGYIEDLAQVDVAPDFAPFRVQIAGQALAEGVRRLLVVILQEVDLRDAVVSQRTGAIGLKRPLILLEGLAEFAELRVLLASTDRDGHAHLAAVAQHAIVGIDDHAARLAERIHAEFTGGADHLHFFLFWIALGFDLEIHRHAEGVQVLRDLTHHAKALLRTKNRIFEFKLRSSATLDPLDEEIPQ